MDMCYVSGFEVGMNNLSCMDTFLLWYGSYLYYLHVVYMVGCVLLLILFLFQHSTTRFGGWRYFWMDGGNHVCIHIYLCIFGMHGWLAYVFIVISYICLCYAFRSLYHSFIYVWVKEELHLKSSPKIFVITPYVLSSSKRRRLLAKRPLALCFDDYKLYAVRY